MAVISEPILVRDITALSSPGLPVSVETTKASRDDDVLGHGWLARATMQPGMMVFTGHYESYEAYTIGLTENPCFVVSLYLGDGYRSEFGGEEQRYPSGHYSVHSFDEPTPQKLHRGESKLQKRCQIWLRPNWINSGAAEQWDDTGLLRKAFAQPPLRESGRASPQMISAASKLFAASSWEGPLAGLRREVATLSFMAEALVQLDARQARLPTPAVVRKMMRVKEQLDSLPPYADIGLIELAAAHNLSVRSLNRYFRTTFDMTVLGYIADRRMEAVRVALERDEMTIDQAAYLAGFSYTTNFSSAFRQRYGYAPSKVRGSKGSNGRGS